ncbi:hypothetical protein D0X99_17880 [Algoriphagus lacus]|uniref:PhoD-like phosphatase metallophosphatase domain-containing protein n=1 Tax=Algoriphagus lacus TaxID=2056311 RepID=A0A418PMU9_9BACT|nr:hypothetical protein [Algoriphagus lacus]RIW12963.1 hypothetical protein D0X99_17880 [Algoriphagus lacus]
MPFQKMICGPILRRVEKDKVSVWAAFMSNQHITLKIWEGDNIKHTGGNLFTTGSSPLAEGETHTLQFGQNLWIALATVTIPSPGLQSGQVYSYNMVYRDSDGTQDVDFLSDKFLSDEKSEGDRPQLAIGYKKDVLPSFCLPGETPDKLNIIHGSCRKMHGHGEDALALLDSKIKDNLDKPDKRPQALFLTGDQIYADEVPGFFLRSIASMDGSSLFGPNTEKMKINEGSGAAQEFEADMVNYPPYFRQRLVNKYAGFSSQAAANHLLSFEEFAATYLRYWNIRSWSSAMVSELDKIAKASPDELYSKVDSLVSKFVDSSGVDADTNLVNLIRGSRPTDSFIFSEDSITKAQFSDSNSDKYKDWLKHTKLALKHELVDMAAFMKKLPEVSRVLANVPTYMIMDDHEVTDDWFMTKRWNNQVLSKPFGRDIIRNAMMAYAVFQDWGNNPEEYKEAISMIFDEMTDSTKKKAQFLLYTGEYAYRYANNMHLNTLRTEVIEKMENMLGMGSSPTSLKWNYSVKLGATQAIVLDTRTQRHYQSLNTTPELISESGLSEQAPNTLTDNPPFVFVVSPCPVLGLPNFEDLVQPAATAVIALAGNNEGNPGILGGELNFDFEAWGFNVTGFERLIAKLDSYKKVVLLSGDVHYGATTVLDYWKGSSADPSSRMVQLTSSALKNEWIPNVRILKSAMVQRILTSFGDGLSKFGWKDKLVSTSGAVTPRNRQRLRHTVATIPIEGWTPGATVNPAPDWRWKLKVLKDMKGLEEDPVESDLVLGNADSMKEGYFKIVSRHQKAYIDGKSPRIAWNSNVGWVTFTADGDSWKLKHELLGAKMAYEVPLKTPEAERAKPELPT